MRKAASVIVKEAHCTEKEEDAQAEENQQVGDVR